MVKEKIKTKWEYKIIQLSCIIPILIEEEKERRHSGFSEWETELNELGKDGWELVGISDDGGEQICFLKRIEDNFLYYSQGNTKNDRKN